jgi:DNA-binding NtrC family response regulator
MQSRYMLAGVELSRDEPAPRRVLLVADAARAGLFSEWALARGHRCGIVGSLPQAAEAVAPLRYDVVVVDRLLVGGGGAVFLRTVAWRYPAMTRVLIMPSLLGHEHDPSVAHAYLVNPVQRSQLIDAIERPGIGVRAGHK